LQWPRPTANCGGSGTRRFPRRRTRKSGSTRHSTCASGSAQCRSWSGTTRAATSSEAHAISTSNSKRAQRTAINTECKLLLLKHAFESLGCIAVEFRTHWFNHASRAAIERLGAKQDGVLRSHQLMPDGSRRDTVVFSIVDGEWPAVKAHLRFLLARPRSARGTEDA